MTWGINFLSNNVTDATLQAKSVLKAFASSEVTAAGVTLDMLEFGNEPDIYGTRRQANWTIQNYVTA